VRKRFLLDIFLVRELIDLRWTFRDTLRFTFVSLGQKTVSLGRLRVIKSNGGLLRQVDGSASPG
jgi:hypothetical protein